MLHVTSATHIGEFRLRLEFSDGTMGDVNLSGRLDGPIFKPLQDVSYFANFDLSGPTLEWPNGADFAPEYLQSLMSSTAQTTHADG